MSAVVDSDEGLMYCDEREEDFNMKTAKKVTSPPVVCDEKKAIKRPQKETYDIAIDALVSGESVTNAAAIAGIRRETLSRWINGNPVFIAKLNKKKNEARGESLAIVNSIVAQSAVALRVALRHPEINPTAVVQSIMSMLPKMYKLMLEQEDAPTSPLAVLIDEEAKKRRSEAASVAGGVIPPNVRAYLDLLVAGTQALLDLEALGGHKDEYHELIKERGKKFDELGDRITKVKPEDTILTTKG
jgi:hypothetical protein